ncbi:hypothetical protein [Nonomuraea sp. B19D2]|uniref:hypothetical protein n=1 Tax=Nonomuraea sp. B19D2 TaxID=3159561 RepID=UPI0032DBBE5C
MSSWKFWPASGMVLVLMIFAVVHEFQDADPPPVSQPLPSATPSDAPFSRWCETPRPTLSPSTTPAATPSGIARGWRVRTFPSHDTHSFRNVAATRDGSVWVVGSRRTAGPPVVCGLSTLTNHPVLRRWDGRAWHELSAPPELSALETVAVAGETAWVFGQCRDAADPYAPCYARWTGAGWQGGTFESGRPISDAVVLDDGQVWAIPQPEHNDKGHVFHWDGRSWQQTALPFEPQAVGASERGGVWAVGGVWNEDERARPAMARWDGRAWHSLPVPSRAKGLESLLTQVVVEEPGQVWILAESWRMCLNDEGEEETCDERAHVLRRNARGGPDRPTGLWRQNDEALLSYRSTGVWEMVARMDVNALAVTDRGLWAAGQVSYNGPQASYVGWTSSTYLYGAVWRIER